MEGGWTARGPETRARATAKPAQVAGGQPAATGRAAAEPEAAGARTPVEAPSVTAVGTVAAATSELSLFGKRPPWQQWAQHAVRKRRFVLIRTPEDRGCSSHLGRRRLCGCGRLRRGGGYCDRSGSRVGGCVGEVPGGGRRRSAGQS